MTLIVHNPLGIERITRSKVGIHYLKEYIPNPHDISHMKKWY
jgi:hypothetical protein